MIILFFGQPASGKTTLAKDFISQGNYLDGFVHIDGDKWRDITDNKDYSKEGRMRNLKGAFDMALYLEKEGFLPVLSFVTPYEELREYLNEKAEKLKMIYLTYDEERGRTQNFAKDFEKPFAGEYLLLNTSSMTIVECTQKVINFVTKL